MIAAALRLEAAEYVPRLREARDEARSLSGVRIDDRRWGRYLDIPLACPRNRERYRGASGHGTGENSTIGGLLPGGGETWAASPVIPLGLEASKTRGMIWPS